MNKRKQKTIMRKALSVCHGIPGQAIVTPTVSADAVPEIRRFKPLMEQGIIMEEEFAAKKRQLLGI